MDYICIDTEAMAVIAKGDYRQLTALTYARHHDTPVYIAPVAENRTYSHFTAMELKKLLGQAPVPGLPGEYAKLIAAARKLCEETPLCQEPLHVLENECAAFDRANPGKPTLDPAPTSPTKAVTKNSGGQASPSPRPKEGTATGLVWDIADKVRAANPESDPKSYRDQILSLCVDAGINPATAQVQYGKWKKSLTV